jgi:hypothetical protein
MSNPMTCTCCEEQETHPLCNGLCIDCARPSSCAECDNLIDAQDWEPGQPTAILCGKCSRNHNLVSGMDELESAVRSLAAQHGWSVSSDLAANTRSAYLTLTRGEDENGDARETVKVRISDHPSVHGSEDYSLVAGERIGMLDHDIATVEGRLAREVK